MSALTALARTSACLVTLVIVATGCSVASGGQEAVPLPDDVLAAAEKALEEASAELAFEEPGPPVDAARAQGSSIAVVAISLAVPALAEIDTALHDVADLVGASVQSFDAKGQVNQMQFGVQQAIDNDADAVVLLGIPGDLVRSSLLAAQKQGIPVVNVINNQPDAAAAGQGAGDGFYATVAPDFTRSGELVAYEALRKAGAEGSFLIITSPELQPAAVTAGMHSVLDSCQACTVIEKEVPLEKWGTDIAPLVVSTIQGNPELDYVLPIFDDMAVLATAGVQQASATGRVRVASLNASPAALTLVENGKVMSADPGISNGWAAWATIDQCLRGILGMEPADPVIPTRFIDTDLLERLGSIDPEALFGEQYQDGYRRLWNVS